MNGGPAFPFSSGPEPRQGEFHERSEGMTLRDWFAGQVAAALVDEGVNYPGAFQRIADRAFKIADAMIAARNLQPPNRS